MAFLSVRFSFLVELFGIAETRMYRNCVKFGLSEFEFLYPSTRGFLQKRQKIGIFGQKSVRFVGNSSKGQRIKCL